MVIATMEGAVVEISSDPSLKRMASSIYNGTFQPVSGKSYGIILFFKAFGLFLLPRSQSTFKKINFKV